MLWQWITRYTGSVKKLFTGCENVSSYVFIPPMARAGRGTLDNTLLQPGNNFYAEPRRFVTTLLLERWPVHFNAANDAFSDVVVKASCSLFSPPSSPSPSTQPHLPSTNPSLLTRSINLIHQPRLVSHGKATGCGHWRSAELGSHTHHYLESCGPGGCEADVKTKFQGVRWFG